tara:strand:- start:41 stop:628 length:588 start_codon:yes stop_codon:yes gene_type:complete
MPIAINGSGTVTGVSVGGLPDGIVDTDMIANNAVTAPKRGAGAILEVVSTTKTNVFSTSSTGSWIDLTGLSVSITTTGSNKVKLEGTIFVGAGNNSYWHIRLVRTSTPIFIGDASGSQTQCTFSGYHEGNNIGYHQIKNQGFSFLDTPSAGTHTYKAQVYLQSGPEIIINRNSIGSNATEVGKGVSSILASEVAA